MRLHLEVLSRDDTQSIHFLRNPLFDMRTTRNFHDMLSKAFSKSSLHRIPLAFVLLHYDKILEVVMWLSKINLSLTKAVWDGEIGESITLLIERIFKISLKIPFSKLMGWNSLTIDSQAFLG